MDSQKQLYMLRVCSLLVKEYGYQLMKVDDEQINFFLINPNDNKTPIIRITSDLSSSPSQIKEIIDLIQQTHAQVFREEQTHPILTIVMDEVAEESEALTSFTPLHQSDSLLKQFPKLQMMNWSTKDPLHDQEMVTRELNQQRRRPMKLPIFKLKGTMFFLIAIVVMYLISLYIQTVSQYETTYMIFLGGIYVPFIQGAHEVWRFLTAGFLHVSMSHLLFNFIAMFTLGANLEKVYGTKTFVTTVLISIIMGNLFVYIGEFTSAVTVGLSSGLYGLMGLMLVYYFETQLIKIPAFRSQLISIFLINFVVNFLPGISWLGHLGGFIGGVFCGFIFSKNGSWNALRQHGKIALLLTFTILGYLFTQRPKVTKFYIASDLDSIQVARKLHFNGYADYLETNMFKLYKEQ